MRLLIITQKVDINDDNLGFFHGWIEKFSGKLDKVYLVCLARGAYNLPKNVVVYSLGKEEGASKIGQLIRLQKYLIKILPKVDGIFVHMCPIYAIASYPLTKIFRKKMILWFLHKQVSWKLKLAEKCADRILTASKESCRLKNRKKIRIVGHGIDVEKFKIQNAKVKMANQNQPYGEQAAKFRIISAGRISLIKDQETLIRAVNNLVNQKNIQDIEIKIIGTPIDGDEKEYFVRLKNLIQEKKLANYIEFLGGVPNNEMPKYYQESDLFINLSCTGSIDKVVLEAMASGCLVLTCNEAFENILEKKYLFKKKDPKDLAEKIVSLAQVSKDKNLREIVIKHHNLDDLIEKILNEFKV